MAKAEKSIGKRPAQKICGWCKQGQGLPGNTLLSHRVEKAADRQTQARPGYARQRVWIIFRPWGRCHEAVVNRGGTAELLSFAGEKRKGLSILSSQTELEEVESRSI